MSALGRLLDLVDAGDPGATVLMLVLCVMVIATMYLVTLAVDTLEREQ